jgi:hypothetical protein
MNYELSRLYEMLNVTRGLDDPAFESLVDQLRLARRAARSAVAYERQMHTATKGVSTRIGLEADAPSDQKLIRQYIAVGFTAAEAQRKVRELEP